MFIIFFENLSLDKCVIIIGYYILQNLLLHNFRNIFFIFQIWYIPYKFVHTMCFLWIKVSEVSKYNFSCWVESDCNVSKERCRLCLRLFDLSHISHLFRRCHYFEKTTFVKVINTIFYHKKQTRLNGASRFVLQILLLLICI